MKSNKSNAGSELKLKAWINVKVLAAVIPIFLAVATPAQATYKEQLAQKAELQNKINEVNSFRQRMQELQIRYFNKGDLDTAQRAERMIKNAEKDVSTLERKLKGVEAKIANSEKLIAERARDIVRDGMRDNARTAARSGIGDTVRSGVRTASQGATRTTSAPASPAPYCSPSPGGH